MSMRQNYLKILSRIVPAGAFGVSLLLGTTTPGTASQGPPAAQPRVSDQMRVSERLAAIRDAVSTVAGEQAAKYGERDLRLAWGNWWRNGGWGYRPWGGWGWPNWNNWHNWHNWNNWWRNW
ncbi:MAG TPA: hypothetical protein VGM07_22525 [Stellaceae bacterium]|jgi:hypothetical protein